MQRSKLNYAVDLVTVPFILAITATGLILRFVLPPGSGGRAGGGGLVLFGWSRHDWGDIHFWLTAGLGAIIVTHVALHWAWVCAVTRNILMPSHTACQIPSLNRNLAGAAFVLGVVGILWGFTWWATRNVEFRPPQHNGLSADSAHASNSSNVARTPMLLSDDTVQVRGSMTLGELARASGTPIEILRSRLGLPLTVSSDDRLGHLRRKFGFKMSDVRRAVGLDFAQVSADEEQTP